MQNWEIQAWEVKSFIQGLWQVDGFSIYTPKPLIMGTFSFWIILLMLFFFIRKFFFLLFSYQILFIPKPMSNRTEHANWPQWSHRNKFAYIRWH